MNENGGHSKMPEEVLDWLKSMVPAYLIELKQFEQEQHEQQRKDEAKEKKLVVENKPLIRAAETEENKENEEKQISFQKYPQKIESHHSYQVSPTWSENNIDEVMAADPFISSDNFLASVPMCPISRSPPLSRLNSALVLSESKFLSCTTISNSTHTVIEPESELNKILIVEEKPTSILAIASCLTEIESVKESASFSMLISQETVLDEISKVPSTHGSNPISISPAISVPATTTAIQQLPIPGLYPVFSSASASLPICTAFPLPQLTNMLPPPPADTISVSVSSSNDIPTPVSTNASIQSSEIPVPLSINSSFFASTSSTASYQLIKPSTARVSSKTWPQKFSTAMFTRNENDYDFNCMPDRVAKKLFYYFEYRYLKLCRLVCSSWNQHIQSHRKFLESSVFHMSTNIEVIKLFESSSVEWMYIHFQGITSENKTRVNYQQKFLQSKFQPYTILTNSLISLTLYKSEIGKDSFLRWLTACKWLRILEIKSCSFISCVGRTGWRQDVLALEHLRILSIEDMSLPLLVDTMKLLYSQVKCLEELKICERKRDPGQTKNIVTTMESELISLVKRFLQKSRPRIYSLFVSVQKFENDIILYDFFKKLPNFQIRFLDFGFEVVTYKGTNCYTVNIGTEFNPLITLKGIFKRSEYLKSLYIPGLAVNFSSVGDISSSFPPCLEELSAQISLPDSNPESNLILGHQKPEFSLRKVAIHENPMTDYQWMNLKKYFPLLTHLTVLCSSFGDHSLMTISSCLVNLTVLKLEKFKHITDFGLTGIGEEYLKSLKESWPDIPESGCKSSEGIYNFPLVGRPVSSITNLRVFHCVGSTDISDVGIAHGLFLSNLKNLSITGSCVKISDTGLDVLSSNSPFLSIVNLSLSPKCASMEGIDQFVSKLPNFDSFKSVVELKLVA